MNDFFNAQRMLKRVLEEYPQSEIIYRAQLALGKLYYNTSQFAEALNEFRLIVTKQKNEIAAEAQYWIGQTLFQQQKYTEAAVEFLKVKYLYPGYVDWVVRAIYQAALVNEKQKRYGEARLLYQTIIKQFNNKEFQKKAKFD